MQITWITLGVGTRQPDHLYQTPITWKSVEEIESLTSAGIRKLSESFFGGAHELSSRAGISSPAPPRITSTIPRANCPTRNITGSCNSPSKPCSIFTSTTPSSLRHHFPELAPAGRSSLDHLHKQLVVWMNGAPPSRPRWKSPTKPPTSITTPLSIFPFRTTWFSPKTTMPSPSPNRGTGFPPWPSTPVQPRPSRGTYAEELRGFSDLVHACHAAMGCHIPCNEEWYYSPRDAVDVMPCIF